MENWKDIVEEENWASKARLVPLFLMDWQASMFNIMLKFLNTFLIKGTNIYFGHKGKMYAISKQLIIEVFKICAKGSIEDPKGKVSKSLAAQPLQSCRLALTNSSID